MLLHSIFDFYIHAYIANDFSLTDVFNFFQADRVEMYWNRKGTGVLLLTSMEVDKTGSSYYGGKQSLHFLSVKGETAMVLLSK